MRTAHGARLVSAPATGTRFEPRNRLNQTDSIEMNYQPDSLLETVASENLAVRARITCNRTQARHDLQELREFLREVHSPCVARRGPLWEYRTEWLRPIDSRFAPLAAGVETDCEPGIQLQTTSDLRWLSEADMVRFHEGPNDEIRSLMTADVRELVAESTIYDVTGQICSTLIDRSGQAAPCGPVPRPTWDIFLRARVSLPDFAVQLRALAARWASDRRVVRLRFCLLQPPDPAGAQRAVVARHPPERQYQGLIQLQTIDASGAREQLGPQGLNALGEICAAVHAYPVSDVYTWNRAGKPTLAGLRGYPAARAISAFNALQHATPGVLEWMYGLPGQG
jgi:hypothetical protein